MQARRAGEERKRQVDFTANFTLNNNINCPSMEEEGGMRPPPLQNRAKKGRLLFILRSLGRDVSAQLETAKLYD